MKLLLVFLALSAFASGSGLSDNFSTGRLNTNLWTIDTGRAPGNNSTNSSTFSSYHVSLSQGVLALKLTQSLGSNGVIQSVGAEVRSLARYGYGTYSWTMRTASTATCPTCVGAAVPGQTSAGFSFVNNSQTEIDFEVEGGDDFYGRTNGGDLNTVWMTNWSGLSAKQWSTYKVIAPDANFHTYKFVWTSSSISFYVDGTRVSVHTLHIPTAPAYIIMNLWGTNNIWWGGYKTLGATRYLYIRNFTFTAQ